MKLLHWFKHLLGLNTGSIHTWWEGNVLMVGFKCDECGEINGGHESRVKR